MASQPSLMNNLSGGWQRLDRWLLRRAWAPTTEGLVWFILATVIMLQGLVRGFNLVTFIATFLLSMWLLNMLVTLFSAGKLSRLNVRRRMLGSVHVGMPINLSLEVDNGGLATVNGVRLIDEGTNHSNIIGLSHLDPFERTEVKKQIVPLVRGEYRWEPLLISTGYPFGLYRRTIVVHNNTKPTLVLPMLGQLDVAQFQRWLKESRRANALLTRVRAKRSTAPADFYGIREYRSGDSARWIHWRTTARVGRPMVREFEEPPQTHITMIIDISLPDTEATLRAGWKAARSMLKQTEHFYQTNTAPVNTIRMEQLQSQEASCRDPLQLVEEAISLACTLCHTWTRKLGSTVTLGILDGNETLPTVLESGPNLRQLTPMMERLAQVKAIHEPSSKQLLKQLEQTALPAGPILLIAPRAGSFDKTLSRLLGRPVQLLDLSKPQLVRRFFKTEVKVSL